MEWLWYLAVTAVGAGVVFGLTPIVEWMLHRIDPEGAGVQSATLRGGRWIGRLERAWTFIAVYMGAASMIAVLVAIKGLGRFGELRDGDAAFAERFIIGTLLSIGAAAAVALVMQRLELVLL